MSSKAWWGFDLDATIAFYETWGDGSIGAHIVPMIRRMKHYIRTGRKVSIVSARVHRSEPDWQAQEELIRQFLDQALSIAMANTVDIRCDKDRHMIALYDDRAEQVIPNKGILVREELRRAVTALSHIAVRGDKRAIDAIKSLDPWSRALSEIQFEFLD